MYYARLRRLLGAGILSLSCAVAWDARAGGSSLNTVVIANQSSSNSCELANYYCERRGVPPDNLLRIAWSGGNISWISDEFQAYLVEPLLDMLASRSLTNQIDYVVLSMDIPFQTINSGDGTVNSTTSSLFYGVRSSGAPDSSTNSYAFSESVFSQAPPTGSPGYSFLTTMITGDSLADAERVVDQGSASDGTFPVQPVVLAKSSDPLRNIRYLSSDNAIFNVRILGASSILRTNTDALPSQGPFLGYETGLANFSVPSSAFVPGAMADSLTSYGGVIFGANDQTSLLAFLNAGAAGSYGTVAEPGTDTLKFPNPQDYFYQARGFSLAESYYQSVSIPYLGLVAGEPLAAPFQQMARGAWLVSNSVLTATAQLPVQFYATDGAHPLQQVDLFIDGKYFSTLTSLTPSPGNLLSVVLNGYPVTYTVPANATLRTVAAGLAAVLNAPAVTNITATNAVLPAYRAEFLPTSFPPQLTMPARDRTGAPRLHVDTLPGMPIVIQASSNLADWFPLFSWPAGGPLDYADPAGASYPRRLYRVSGSPAPNWLGPGLPPSTTPAVTVLSGPGYGGSFLQLAGSVWPYMIESSTSSGPWTPLSTNLEIAQIQTEVINSSGSAGALTTALVPSRSSFLNSAAYGFRQYKVPSSSPQVGAWLQFTITKTNGAVVVVGVTNQTSGTTSAALAAQLYNLINSNPGLQGSEGVVAEDFYVNTANLTSFNLRARRPGLQASAIQVLPARYGMIILPSSLGSLTQNLSDLQPRNHIYVTAGATSLACTLGLDTTTLADGYHELAAVAYEGSAVHTQTQITLPVQITNSPLAATITLLDLTNTAPVGGTYHIQVAANTNTVSAIQLFSTGGILATVTSQPVATFTVGGSFLGAGLHPFYALVETSDGLRYRTQTRTVRFVH